MPRRPYPRLIAATALAAVPAILLLVLISAPVAPGCFEYCELGQDFAVIGLRLLAVVWLVVWLRVAWNWRTREPTVAAVSAVVAGGLLLLVAFTVLTVESFGNRTAELEQIAWILGLGLQLPPVWRLSRRMPPSLPLRVLGWVIGFAGGNRRAGVRLPRREQLRQRPQRRFSRLGRLRRVSLTPGDGGVPGPRRTTVRGRSADRGVPAEPPDPSRDRRTGRSRDRCLHGHPVHGVRLAVGRVRMAPDSRACRAANGRGCCRRD